MTEPTVTTLPNGDVRHEHANGHVITVCRGRTTQDVLDELQAAVGEKAAGLIQDLIDRSTAPIRESQAVLAKQTGNAW